MYVTKYDYHNSITKIWKQSENVYRCYDIFWLAIESQFWKLKLNRI